MDQARKIRLKALAITLLMAILMLLCLVCCSLSTTSIDGDWPPEKQDELFFDVVEEPVKLPAAGAADSGILENGDGSEPGASDVSSDDATQLSYDAADNAPEAGIKTDVTHSEVESPAKVTKDDSPKGSRDPKADAERAEAERRQKANQNISSQLNSRFGGGGRGQGATTTDGVEGTRTTGGASTSQGLGMTASADVRPHSILLGTIVVNVTVLPDGSVRPGSASLDVSRCKGKAADDENLRKASLNAAYRCRFSRPAGQTNNLPGSITFKWE